MKNTLILYAAFTYGVTGEEDGENVYGKIRLGYWHVSLTVAKAEAEQAFLTKQDKRSNWVKAARAWASSRDPEDDRLYLWSFLPSAAPAMDDPNRDFYPQARPTNFWIEQDTVEY